MREALEGDGVPVRTCAATASASGMTRQSVVFVSRTDIRSSTSLRVARSRLQEAIASTSLRSNASTNR